MHSRRWWGPPPGAEWGDQVGMTKENAREGTSGGTRGNGRRARRGSKNDAKRRRQGGREEDLGGGEEAGKRGTRERFARRVGEEGAGMARGVAGGRGNRRKRRREGSRSGGNSAINTNIFRSVLQPCFDNHPLQRSRRALSVMRFLPSGPLGASPLLTVPSPYPFTLFPPIFVPLFPPILQILNT